MHSYTRGTYEVCSFTCVYIVNDIYGIGLSIWQQRSTIQGDARTTSDVEERAL